MKRHRHILHPLQSARIILGHRRTAGADLVLATVIAFTAGAANAGGFFALGQYTSHVTGYLSQLADHLVVAEWWICLVAIAAIGAFVTGAAFCSLLIHWARVHMPGRQYALSVAVQGLFLMLFATGGWFESPPGRLWSAACLCFTMGMQNATVSKISGGRLRATHATAMVTDIGIGLGRALYRRHDPEHTPRVDWHRMRLMAQLVFTFFLGGVTGALGYARVGFLFSLPLGCLLLAMALPALWRYRQSL
ncbi:YoaK family protein [Pseudogemmobacter bohemicus]|uniref:YoaK family protein n=1 Tax=Pseudogemmobacter bohemicus TaxID=2250708 RepID=UPI0013006AA9|nr:YoaK family protein [Pseudogemmobacter bohemicus]